MKLDRATPRPDAGAGDECTGGPCTEHFATCGHTKTETATASRTPRVGARKSFIGLLIAAATVAVALLIPAVAQASGPQLTTGFSDYMPGGIVDVHGTGFDANMTYAMPVMRPDTSIVIVDALTHYATPGWEFATSDPMGNLTYNYQLDGIYGGYEARA